MDSDRTKKKVGSTINDTAALRRLLVLAGRRPGQQRTWIMALSIRQATVDDLLQMQTANLWCLPENYQMKYYLYHVLSWPQLLFVAEDHKGELGGEITRCTSHNELVTTSSMYCCSILPRPKLPCQLQGRLYS